MKGFIVLRFGLLYVHQSGVQYGARASFVRDCCSCEDVRWKNSGVEDRGKVSFVEYWALGWSNQPLFVMLANEMTRWSSLPATPLVTDEGSFLSVLSPLRPSHPLRHCKIKFTFKTLLLSRCTGFSALHLLGGEARLTLEGLVPLHTAHLLHSHMFILLIQ